MNKQQSVRVGEPRTTCDCGCGKNIKPGNSDEIVRLQTFPDRWSKSIPAEELARYGFIYVGPFDTVECCKCGVQIRNWRDEDLAGVEHLYWNPACPLLTRKGWWGFKTLPECYVAPEKMPNKCFMMSEGHPIEQAHLCDERSRSKLRFEEERLATFKNAKFGWNYPVSKEDLARYGFYYMGGTDTVKCHFCGLIINGWQKQDLAFLEHLKYSPDCPLLKRIARQNNVTLQERSNCFHNICEDPIEDPTLELLNEFKSSDLPFFNCNSQDLSGLSPRSLQMIDDLQSEVKIVN
jgi:hypothetical protein